MFVEDCNRIFFFFLFLLKTAFSEIIYAQGLAAEEQLLKFFSGERRQTIFCVVYNMLFDTKKIHPVIYS